MPHTLSDIPVGDYMMLFEYIMSNDPGPGGKGVGEMLGQLIVHETFIEFMNSSREYVVHAILSACISAHVLLDYKAFFMEATRLRMRTLFWMLSRLGASYYADPNEVLSMIGSKPDETSLKMLNAFIESLSLSHPRVGYAIDGARKPIIFLISARDAGCTQIYIDKLVSENSLITVLYEAHDQGIFDLLLGFIYSDIVDLEPETLDQLRALESEEVDNALNQLGYESSSGQRAVTINLGPHKYPSCPFDVKIVLALGTEDGINEHTGKIVEVIRQRYGPAFEYQVFQHCLEQEAPAMLVARALSMGFDINAKGPNNKVLTTNMINDPVALHILIEAGANPFADEDQYRQIYIIQRILECIDMRDLGGFINSLRGMNSHKWGSKLGDKSVLSEAISTGDIAFVRVALLRGLSPSVIDYPSFVAAIDTGNHDIIALVLAAPDVHLNQADKQGRTAFHAVMEKEDLWTFEQMLLKKHDQIGYGYGLTDSTGAYAADIAATKSFEFFTSVLGLVDTSFVEDTKGGAMRIAIERDHLEAIKMMTKLYLESRSITTAGIISKILLRNIFEDQGFLDYAVLRNRHSVVSYFKSQGIRPRTKPVEEQSVTFSDIYIMKLRGHTMRDVFDLAVKVVEQGSKALLIKLFDELGVPALIADTLGRNLYSLTNDKPHLQAVVKTYGIESDMLKTARYRGRNTSPPRVLPHLFNAPRYQPIASSSSGYRGEDDEVFERRREEVPVQEPNPYRRLSPIHSGSGAAAGPGTFRRSRPESFDDAPAAPVTVEPSKPARVVSSAAKWLLQRSEPPSHQSEKPMTMAERFRAFENAREK
jgi:hypothetical protein